MTLSESIKEKITSDLSPTHLEVVNESAMHSVPPGSETHFRLLVVSDAFKGKSLLERQKRVNQILAEELRNKVHALAMQTLTPDEWRSKGHQKEQSPPCLGGSKNS